MTLVILVLTAKKVSIRRDFVQLALQNVHRPVKQTLMCEISGVHRCYDFKLLKSFQELNLVIVVIFIVLC